MKPFRTIFPHTAAALLTGVLLLFAGCEKEKNKCEFCGVNNPLEELEWLKENIKEMEKSVLPASISKCLYQNNKQGFLFTSCENNPDNMTVLVDCSGKILCAIGGYAGKKDTIYNIDGNSIETIYKNY